MPYHKVQLFLSSSSCMELGAGVTAAENTVQFLLPLLPRKCPKFHIWICWTHIAFCPIAKSKIRSRTIVKLAGVGIHKRHYQSLPTDHKTQERHDPLAVSWGAWKENDVSSLGAVRAVTSSGPSTDAWEPGEDGWPRAENEWENFLSSACLISSELHRFGWGPLTSWRTVYWLHQFKC